MPQHAWDKTSLAGKVGNYDETTEGAKAVYGFLQKQGGDMSTFGTSPLWKVVDGPWKLGTFESSGYYSWVPNKNYSGPDKPILDKVAWTPFTPRPRRWMRSARAPSWTSGSCRRVTSARSAPWRATVTR